MRKQLIAAFAFLALNSIGPTDALAQNKPSQAVSDQRIHNIRMRLEGVLTALDAERSDYGGHKAKAHGYLSEARSELLAAEEYAHSQGK